MSTFNGDSYTSLKNLNLRGGASGTGLLRWQPAEFQAGGVNWPANPFGSADYGLYINSSNQLVYSALGTPTVLGTPGGGGSIPSFNAIWSVAQTLQLAGVSTFTIDNNTGNNNVLTLTNSGAGSGVVLQITNTGSGSDISGTSGTWSFSNTGVATMLTATLAGSAGATSLALTLGNIVVSAGGLSLTKAANNATLSVTNNTATTASVFVFAGSGAYTGTTTTSFFTITASGLTTGTAVYIPTVALSTGKALQLNYAGTTSHTSGIQFQILSSATAMTASGRLFSVSHTGVSSASGAGILAEFITAATDGTDVLKLTASSTTTGTLLWVAMAQSLTGLGISIPNVDAITTGFGVSVVGSSTALTSTGRFFLVSHTGASSSTGTVAEFITAATDSTVLLKLTSAALVSGINLSIVGTTGMTTGSLIRATSSTAAAVATNGIYSFLLTAAFTSGASTVGAFHIAGASTVSGTIVSILGGAQTTGIALNITDPSTGMTSGSLLRVISATTGAVATNGVVSFQLSGAYTSAASTVGAVHVSATSTTAGTILSVRGDGLTTGIGLSLSDGAGTGITSGSLIRVVSASTGAVATNGIVSFQSSGAFTSTTIGFVNVLASGATAGTIVAIQASAASQTATTALQVVQTNTTTGYTGNLVSFVGSGTTGAGNVLSVAGVGTTAGNVVSITNASSSQTGAILLSVTQSGTTTGFTGSVASLTGSHTTGGDTLLVTDVTTTTGNGVHIISNALVAGTSTAMLIAHTTSVLGAGNSLLRLSSTSVDTGTTTGNLLDLSSTASLAGTQVLLTASALTTGIGLSVAVNALTTGLAVSINHTTSVIASGGSLLQVSSTSVDTASTSGALLNLSSTASTAGTQVLLTASALTTGIAASLVLNALTTGTGLSITSSSSNAGAYSLLSINNSNATSSAASYPVVIANAGVVSTNFSRIMKLGAYTIWISNNNTAANTNLSGTAGDICINGGSSSGHLAYCTGTTNWTSI